MSERETPVVQAAGWDGLRRFTDARIALGRAGHSQPTAAHLAFQLAHAQARDAVHLPFDITTLAQGVQGLGLNTLCLRSAAHGRATYLQRPDLGRRPDADGLQRLHEVAAEPVDLSIVIADGLSALGAMQNALPLLQHLLALLQADPQPWTLAPVVLVEQGRVAVGDPVGEALRAKLVVVLIGERPGLSSPDSLGIYFTWAPRPGLTDAQRNCISNVREAGLPPERAARKLHTLMAQARRLQISGVALKDETDDAGSPRLHVGGSPTA